MTANVPQEESNDESGESCFQILHELSDKLGISPGIRLISVYKQLLLHNKKISRNILSLAAVYYTANLNFYFPIFNLVRFCENAETQCSLHQKFVKIWVKSGLDPPAGNTEYIVDFVLNRNRKIFPPKISQGIFEIMHTIKKGLVKMNASELKLPLLTCLAFYFHKGSTSESNNICNLLHLTKSVVKKNKSFIMQCKHIICDLRSLDICIDL